jgi:hypothetical protein
MAQAGGSLALTRTRLSYNRALGYTQNPAYTYGQALDSCQGGGLHTEALTSVIECTITSNQVVGGASGPSYTMYAGGLAVGGGVSSRSALQMQRSTLNGNTASGGDGPEVPPGSAWSVSVGGGGALGGGLGASSGSVRLENCTLTANAATGGTSHSYPDPADAPGGAAQGGGVYAAQSTNLIQYCTVVSNRVVGGAGHTAGQASGSGLGLPGGATVLQNTIAAQNVTAADVSGSFSGNHNLIGVDPLLDSLAFNGGTTWTMALLPGSPAIDAATAVVGVTTDQRGVVRPFGSAPDIGAFERDVAIYTNFVLLSLQPSASGGRVLGMGPATCKFHLETSSNLTVWTPSSSGTTLASGWFSVEIPQAAGAFIQFFRTVSP